jgi:hypothetical protein
MLTKSQIQRFAQRHGVGMQVQERDYLQIGSETYGLCCPSS